MDANEINTQEFEGFEEAWNSWEEAAKFPSLPKKDTYKVAIVEIRETDQKDNPVYFSAVLDYIILEGEYTDRKLTFQRVNSTVFPRSDGSRSSSLIDLLKSAGIAEKPKPTEVEATLTVMRDTQRPFTVEWDFRAFCTPCYEKKLIELTKRPTTEQAKAQATKEQRKIAAKFATKAKTESKFPEVNGVRQQKIICSVCTAAAQGKTVEVAAQGQIVRYLAPSKVEAPSAASPAKQTWG